MGRMQKLVKGLQHFQSTVFEKEREFFEEAARGQNPETLLITCSDSRIVTNLLFGNRPGELFEVRNAGNLVPSYGAHFGAEAAAIEFALTVLNVRHIVVCGHSQCGAMKAVLNPESVEKLPALRDWLRFADITGRVVKDNFAELQGPELLNKAVCHNALCQLDNLRTHPAVAARLIKGDLHLHAWVYEIEKGEVLAYDPKQSKFAALNSTAISADRTPLPA